MNFYTISGLTVASEAVLPGISLRAPDDNPADVAIRQGAVPEALEDAGASGPFWQIAGGQCLVRIPGLARFLMRDGREIVFATEAGTPVDDIAIYLLGTMFGILLHQRGAMVLHASAIDIGGRAVLFCGPSGAGKSTMAAAMVQRGYPLLTDDICAITFDAAGLAHVASDSRQIKLWDQAVTRLELGESRGAPVRGRLKKYYVEPARACEGSLPLAAVYGLRENLPPLQAGIHDLNVVDRALLLRRNAYRPQVVRRLGQRDDYFRAAIAIAGGANVFELVRELDFARLPQVVTWLEEHWARINLNAGAA